MKRSFCSNESPQGDKPKVRRRHTDQGQRYFNNQLPLNGASNGIATNPQDPFFQGTIYAASPSRLSNEEGDLTNLESNQLTFYLWNKNLSQKDHQKTIAKARLVVFKSFLEKYGTILQKATKLGKLSDKKWNCGTS